MKKTTRNIFIAFGIVCLIFTGIIGYGIYRVYTFFNQIGFSKEVPEELKETRVLTGEGFLTKKEIFKLEKQGLLKTIGKSSQIKDEKEREKYAKSESAKTIYNFADLEVFGDKIIAAGEFGAFVFDLDGNLQREILFEPEAEKIKVGFIETENSNTSLDNLEIVKLNNDKFGFLSFGLTQGVVVYDGNGKRIWGYGKLEVDVSDVLKDSKQSQEDFEKGHHVLEAAVGDLDGDNISEYIVAVQNEGFHAFDQNGNKKWFQPDDYPSDKLKIVDVDGDGKNEILEDGGSSSKIRDGNGNVIKEMKTGSGGEMVLFLENEEKKKTPIFCRLMENKMSCEDESGKSFIESTAPLSDIPKKDPKKIEIPGHPEMRYMDDSDRVGFPRAVLVSLKKDAPKYLAVVGAFIGIPRANFYLYDEKGNLVYHELLPKEAETIAIVPTATGNETILIGGKDTIWKYDAADN